MERNEYINVMSEMLDDQLVYRKINADPTNKYQVKINKLLKRFVNEGVMDELMGKSLMTLNALPPRLYGLRKVHKAGCKMRPVVSCIKSPCYKLAAFLHSLVMPVINNFEVNVRNSAELVEFLHSVRLPENYVLVSLDVVSLFTNVPK
ncbi:GSCOCG00011531001-RA-CDS [Cotesia congregata]|nr:GSCOCG00011531001-RA-CDS [Cotesia congregata]